MSTHRNPTTLFLVLGGVGCAILLAAIFWPGGAESTPPGSRSSFQQDLRPSSSPRRLDSLGTAIAPRGPAQAPTSDNASPEPPAPRHVAPGLGQQLMQRQGAAQRLSRATPLLQQPANAPASSPSENAPEAPRGTLAREQIKAAIQEVIPSVRHCYESGLKLREGSRGRVSVSFTLVVADGGGFMRDAEIVDSALNNPLTDSCVLEALSNARFPMPEGGGEVRVTYPFNFESADPDAGVTR